MTQLDLKQAEVPYEKTKLEMLADGIIEGIEGTKIGVPEDYLLPPRCSHHRSYLVYSINTQLWQQPSQEVRKVSYSRRFDMNLWAIENGIAECIRHGKEAPEELMGSIRTLGRLVEIENSQITHEAAGYLAMIFENIYTERLILERFLDLGDERDGKAVESMEIIDGNLPRQTRDRAGIDIDYALNFISTSPETKRYLAIPRIKRHSPQTEIFKFDKDSNVSEGVFNVMGYLKDWESYMSRRNMLDAYYSEDFEETFMSFLGDLFAFNKTPINQKLFDSAEASFWCKGDIKDMENFFVRWMNKDIGK